MDFYKISAMSNGLNTFKYIQKNFEFNPNTFNFNGETAFLILFKYKNKLIWKEMINNDKINYYLKNNLNEDFIDYTVIYNSIKIWKLFIKLIKSNSNKYWTFINYLKKRIPELNKNQIDYFKNKLTKFEDINNLFFTKKSDLLINKLFSKEKVFLKYFK